ncbi:hypothetical protein, partial [Enterobacter sp.]|uniref:hypothetical protein n=1 Tax=Enterobacter sp. TaxID=42895 RepID=UPI0037840E54
MPAFDDGKQHSAYVSQSLAGRGFQQITGSVMLFKSVVTSVLKFVQNWLLPQGITNRFNNAAMA